MTRILEPDTDDNGSHSTQDAFKKPAKNDPPLKWHRGKKPRSYFPFVAELQSKSGNTITYFLLHNTDATRTHAKALTLDLDDEKKTHATIPATIQMAVPGGSKNCGFLFLSQAEMDAVEQAHPAEPAIITSSVGDSKWPKGAGGAATALEKFLASASATFLDKDEREFLMTLLKIL